jgi:hypothetical protein
MMLAGDRERTGMDQGGVREVISAPNILNISW